MNRFVIHSAAAIMGFACLVSCSEQESDLQSVYESSDNQLRIVTHTRGGEEGASSVASIFLFNGSSEYVRTLQTDAAGSYTSASASVKLPQGTYMLCALSPSDLSHFQFPATPSPTSVISQAEGQAMGDLLMASATASLDDGESKTVNLELERKVLELSTVTISQVPDEVTAVTVSVAPFYSGIRFNGSYVEESPLTCTFALAESATAGVWEAAPHQLAFPSKGVPTITVTFTRGETGSSSYTYTAENALTANNRYNISGTYTEPGSGTDDPNAGSGGSDNTETPVAGQTYKGCYVVSVDAAHSTAVLLSPTVKTRIPEIKSQYNNDLDACVKGELQIWQTVDGVTGMWRMPTAVEVCNFMKNSGLYSKATEFIYEDGSVACIASFKLTNNEVSYENRALGYNTILRPVIDITYK